MTLMELPAQHFHDAISGETFEGLDGSAVAHDGEPQAGSRCHAVDHDRASAACPVLAAQVGCRQAAIVSQEIGKCLPGLDVGRNVFAV